MSSLFSPNKPVPVFRLLLPGLACIALLFIILVKRGSVQLLEPAGYVADIQSKVLWGAIIFGAVFGSLIIGMFYIVAFRYKEDAHHVYKPNWTAGKTIQLLCWGIPTLVIIPISIMLWVTAHLVDPYRSISATTTPITIQVVALQWKWLFLYPDDHIATVNMLEIPVGTPVNFELTANAPMNSFWIPRLSGQIYAMTGMVTQLHIEAEKTGTYNGSPAEISGGDFASMDFSVKVVSQNAYAAWKNTTSHIPQMLDYPAYVALAKPSGYIQPAQYQLTYGNLFQVIVMQFMVPGIDPATQLTSGGSV